MVLTKDAVYRCCRCCLSSQRKEDYSNLVTPGRCELGSPKRHHQFPHRASGTDSGGLYLIVVLAAVSLPFSLALTCTTGLLIVGCLAANKLSIGSLFVRHGEPRPAFVSQAPCTATGGKKKRRPKVVV